MDTFYASRIKDKSAEDILRMISDYPSGIPYTGAEADTLLVAAQIRKNQAIIESQNECTSRLTNSVTMLAAMLSKASDDSGKLRRRIAILTGAFVAVGAGQIIATAWPYLAWWWHNG